MSLVAEAVQRHLVPSRHHLPANILVAHELLAEHEEGGPGADLVERTEYRGRGIPVGAVVEGEQRAAAARLRPLDPREALPKLLGLPEFSEARHLDG